MSSNECIVRLKRGRETVVRNRHPWVFQGAIDRVVGQPQPGDIVQVQNSRGEPLAAGYVNPESQISVRLLTWVDDGAEPGPVDEGFWRRRLAGAIARRATLADDANTTAYRLVYAESDGLPGLIVDRYGDWLVLQALTLGIDRRKMMLADLLAELMPCVGIYERSDADVRAHEGLSPVAGPLRGAAPAGTIEIRERGLRFAVDIARGHKTGFYLDQRPNRARLARYCAEAEVLNAFGFTGAFGVYAASHGATRITHIDSSADALDRARENMTLNSLARDNDEYLVGDAFHLLRGLRDRARQFDVVILDPPKFAFTKRQVQAATRGYKDINMLGMRLLRPGGTLCTFSCSGLVSADLFQKVLFGAAVDVGREVRILERLAQGADHPVLLTFPEAAYLKGMICRVD